MRMSMKMNDEENNCVNKCFDFIDIKYTYKMTNTKAFAKLVRRFMILACHSTSHTEVLSAKCKVVPWACYFKVQQKNKPENNT